MKIVTEFFTWKNCIGFQESERNVEYVEFNNIHFHLAFSASHSAWNKTHSVFNYMSTKPI